MSDTDELMRRLEKLEELAAFQERAIEDLGNTVTGQWKQIEAVRRELANLGAQLRDIEANGVVTPQSEPPPPHY
ncbi:MAG: SlyX family protein [Devosia sp.]|nr:SlyX family protein [Devosia sp.]